MRLHATYTHREYDADNKGHDIEEQALIIQFNRVAQDRESRAIFVREDGTLGEDFIGHFKITEYTNKF